MAAIRKARQKNPLIAMIQQMINLGWENFGKYYSCYRAFVADVDDPENLQRIKLIIPQVTGDQIHDYWAFPKGVFYGPGYGQQVVPNKGDMVWVEFEGGQPEIPIWSHGHPARKEMPKDEQLKDKNAYWFITPKGHKVILNDTKNTIQIESRGGDSVLITEQSVSLVTKKQISLGTKDKSEYKAVLGEELVSALKDMQKFTQDFSTALGTDIKSSAGTAFLKYSAMAAANPGLSSLAKGITAKLDKILSNKVTLDK